MDVLLSLLPLNNMLLFSIIIPVFNREKSLTTAIESVLSQTMQNFEVLIVDDGSKPAIAAQIKHLILSFADPRLRLLRHEINKNGAAARNSGIHAAKGQYMCFLDSDDYWLPNKLELVYDCIQTKQQHDNFLIHHQYCNSVNGKLAAALPKTAKSVTESAAHYSFVTNNVGGIQSSTICLPIELAKRCLFDERFRGHQDWDFVLKVDALTSDFRFIPEALTIRGKDSKDSVADELDWQYSLWFYTQMSKHFDSETALYYFQRVVMKKASYSFEISRLFINKLFIRCILHHPLKLFKVTRSFLSQITLRNKRIKYIQSHCEKNNVSKLMIWGMNQYSSMLVRCLNPHLNVTTIIDNKAMQKEFCGIAVSTIHSLEQSAINETDVIILATDVHQNSMLADLNQFFPEAIDKVVKF